MGVKTTSDRVRSCGTTPVLGGALYHTVLLRVGRGRCEGTPGRWDANDVEFGKLWVVYLILNGSKFSKELSHTAE